MDRKRKEDHEENRIDDPGIRQRRRVAGAAGTAALGELPLAYVEKIQLLVVDPKSTAKEIWEHLRKLCISAETPATLNLVDEAVNRHPALIALAVRHCTWRLAYGTKDPVHGRCLLHEAVAVGNLRTAATLLRRGADPKKTDRTGRAAAESHELNMVMKLFNDDEEENSSDDESFDADAESSQQSEDSASEDDTANSDADDPSEQPLPITQQRAPSVQQPQPQQATAACAMSTGVPLDPRSLPEPSPASRKRAASIQCDDTEEDETLTLAPASGSPSSSSASTTPSHQPQQQCGFVPASAAGATAARTNSASASNNAKRERKLTAEQLREIDAVVALVAVVCDMDGLEPLTSEAVDRLVVRALAADERILHAFRAYRSSPRAFRDSVVALLMQGDSMDVNETNISFAFLALADFALKHPTGQEGDPQPLMFV